MGEMGGMGKRGRWVHQEHREIWERQAHMGQLGRRVCMETQVCKGFKERQDCRVHQEEEQSTLAGAVPPAPLTRELHSSTLAELEGHAMTTKEEQQTISVFQTILIISNT